MNKTITIAHGNGGAENHELISKIFYKYFKNEILERSEDAAVLELEGKTAMTTDSFTVSPLFFPGGDIGKLAVCGTCNDLAMMGAKPKYLTCSVIIEEGFSTRELEKIVRSMKKELEINGALIVSGDTKVVPKGSVDGLFINTTGVGEIEKEGVSASGLSQEDVILVSRDIGAHGAAIFMAREGMDMESCLESDCKSLYPIVSEILQSGVQVVAMRDATRGGIAALLNEWAVSSDVCIELEEGTIPVSEEVMGVCELLGFEATNLANEGTFCIATKANHAVSLLELLKRHNQNAAIIGKVTDQYSKRVVLNSSWGTKRFLDQPSGELLPRIC
jgi:hydrogenase expression/formation protein HypE